MSHLKADSFADLVKKRNAEKAQKFKDALLFGHSEAHTDSGRAFVKSCQRFFDKKGYLTPKQVEALFGVDRETFSYRTDDDQDFGPESTSFVGFEDDGGLDQGEQPW